MADGGMRGTTGPGSDGIGKPLDPQYDLVSDRVRRGPTMPDHGLSSDEAQRRRRVPRDGNGNEQSPWGWPI